MSQPVCLPLMSQSGHSYLIITSFSLSHYISSTFPCSIPVLSLIRTCNILSQSHPTHLNTCLYIFCHFSIVTYSSFWYLFTFLILNTRLFYYSYSYSKFVSNTTIYAIINNFVIFICLVLINSEDYKIERLFISCTNSKLRSTLIYKNPLLCVVPVLVGLIFMQLHLVLLLESLLDNYNLNMIVSFKPFF